MVCAGMGAAVLHLEHTVHALVQVQPCAAQGVLRAGFVRCRALQVCVFALLLSARKFVKPEMTE